MFRVEITPQAEKQIRALSKKDQERVLKRLRKLGEDPRPDGCKKLQGIPNLYRIRQGDWRIIYAIEEEELRIWVVKVGHRRDVYR